MTATKTLTPYQGAQKIAAYLQGLYGEALPASDVPKVCGFAGFDAVEVARYGWTEAPAQVTFEAGPFDWAPDFCAGCRFPGIAKLLAELDAAGLFAEPYNGWLLSVYPA